MSRTPFFSSFFGKPHIADLGHAWIADRPDVLQHQYARLIHVQIGAVDPFVIVLNRLKDHRSAPVLHQLGRGSRRLDDRPVLANIAPEHGQARGLDQRRIQRHNHLAIVADRPCDILAERLTRRRQSIQMQFVLQLLDHHRQATSVIKILHQILARGHQVDQ